MERKATLSSINGQSLQGGVKEVGEALWRLARSTEEALEGTIAKE